MTVFKTVSILTHAREGNNNLAGETVNIDTIAGGFNFQNAGTSGFIVTDSIALKTNY